MCDEDKEFEKRVNLYYDDYNKYLIEIIKEVIPRQLVSLYNHNLILKHENISVVFPMYLTYVLIFLI